MANKALLRIVSDGGGAWGLSDEAWLKWWKQIPPDDQQAFEMLGGDELLGRFVCAYDLVTVEEGETPKTLVRAFAIASGKSEEEYETKVLAQRAWESPAVRELLDRLMGREKARAERRIERAAVLLVEDTIAKALETDSLDGRSKAINSAARFLESIKDDRKAAREIRSRLENEQLKKAITQGALEHSDNRAVGEEDLALVRTLVHLFGRERVLAELPPELDA